MSANSRTDSSRPRAGDAPIAEPEAESSCRFADPFQLFHSMHLHDTAPSRCRVAGRTRRRPSTTDEELNDERPAS